MESKPYISVVVPCYNVGEYVYKCLESITSQLLYLENKKNVQIIVVNDGSSDFTWQLLIDYKKKYPDIILIDQKNIGLGPARNVGLKNAKGKYITFVDSDDFLVSNYALAKLYLSAEQTNEYITAGNVVHYYQNNILNVKKQYNNKTYVKAFLELKYSKFFETPLIMAKLYRKDFLDKNRILFDSTWSEDQLFHWKTILSGHGMIVIPDVTYGYLHRSNSLSKNISIENVDELIDIRKQQFSIMYEQEPPLARDFIKRLSTLYKKELESYLSYLEINYPNKSKIYKTKHNLESLINDFFVL